MTCVLPKGREKNIKLRTLKKEIEFPELRLYILLTTRYVRR